MRKLSELRAAEKEACSIVWYNRTLMHLHDIEVHGEPMPPEDIFDRMMAECKKLEARYGEEELLPEDEFEWGVICGRLEALRWAMGSGWSDLDT